MAAPIEHTGRVDRVEAGTVYVTITSSSACGTLQGTASVRAGRDTGKTIVVKCADTTAYAAGDAVTVGVRRSAGALAVVLGYVGALVVLMGALLVTVGALGWNEGAGALAALGAVAVYYIALWALRNRIENTIQFTITKNQ